MGGEREEADLCPRSRSWLPAMTDVSPKKPPPSHGCAVAALIVMGMIAILLAAAIGAGIWHYVNAPPHPCVVSGRIIPNCH
jgi:hypothetical protein